MQIFANSCLTLDALSWTAFEALFLPLFFYRSSNMDYSHITHHKIARHAASRRRLGTGSPGWALIASPSESEAKWQLCLLHLIDFKGRLTVGSLKSPKHIFCNSLSCERWEMPSCLPADAPRVASSGPHWKQPNSTVVTRQCFNQNTVAVGWQLFRFTERQIFFFFNCTHRVAEKQQQS